MVQQTAKTRKSQGVGFNNPAFQPLPKSREVQINGFVKPSGTIVASVINDRNETYFVQVYVSGKITCKNAKGEQCNGRKYTGKCYHVDGVKAASLPSYAQLVAYNLYEVMALVNEDFCADERKAPVTIENVYEELPRKTLTLSAYGSCGHIVHVQHAGTPCGACLCK